MRKKNNAFVKKGEGGAVGAEGWGHNDKPAQRDSHNFKHIFGGLARVSLKSMQVSSKPSHLGFRVGERSGPITEPTWWTPAPLRDSKGAEIAGWLGTGAGSQRGRGRILKGLAGGCFRGPAYTDTPPCHTPGLSPSPGHLIQV